MAVFIKDFYQERREDKNNYEIGLDRRSIQESFFLREELLRLYNEETFQKENAHLGKEDDWWEFYHTSEMRRGLFAWYPFSGEDEIMEVDAGFGAITGLFCDKCKKVVATESSLSKATVIYHRYQEQDNLEVYAGAVEDFDYTKFYGRFDCIVLNHVLEHKGYGYAEQKSYVEYLNLIKSMLKPNGKILMVVTNRYGLKYFCGSREKYTGIPFEGINAYPHGTDAYAFEKGELKKLLDTCEFSEYKFYYPFPDHSFPQVICSDNNFPIAVINERTTFYDGQEDTRVARERCLYRDFMDNGVYGYFANDFIVEVPLQGKPINIDYAVVTADRGKERSFSTVIYDDKIVEKRPLYCEGKKTAKISAENIKQLAAKGISVVKHTYEDGCIRMPYMVERTLSEEIKWAALNNKEHFFELFRHLYQIILQSSNISKVDEKYGPILQECYFDMIPFNCFYDGNELIFYDQEFVKYNYSAKYTLFRAIKYTYDSMWELQDIIPKEQLIEEFHLENIWTEFEEEEERFIHKLKKQEITGLRRWNYENEREIYDRGTNIAIEQQFAPYWGDELRKVQSAQLKMLHVIVHICEKHSIRYYVFFGTLLGAIRHRGFVPWDDDADVVMFREDFDRFVEICRSELPEQYFLQTMESEPECFWGGYSRLRDSETTAIEIQNYNQKINHGVWVDILPLDYIGSDVSKQIQEIHEIQKNIYGIVYKREEQVKNLAGEEFAMIKKRAASHSYEYWTNLLYEKLTQNTEREKVAILASYHDGRYIVFDASWFGEGIDLPFEGIYLNCPQEYDEILRTLYGMGYAQIPPIELREPKHEAYVDPETPFRVTKKRFEGIFDNANERMYIIVGVSELADTFIGKYQDSINIECIIDNEDDRDTFWGYPIRHMQDIHLYEEGKRCVVICERTFRNVEKQLRALGIDDYYIYVHEKWWLLENNEF